MRKLVVLAMVCLLGSLTAACGSDSGSGSEAESGTAFAKVATKFGEVSVPAEPKHGAIAFNVSYRAWSPLGDKYEISWNQQTELIATALGRADKGRELIAATEEKFKQAAAEHPEFAGKTITFGARSSQGYGAYVSGTGRVNFVERLGFRNNPAIQAKATEEFSVPVSRENLGMLNADLTVLTPIGVPAQQIADDPLYQAIASVRAGRAVIFDDKKISSAFATDSVLSIGFALEKVVPMFAAALKG